MGTDKIDSATLVARDLMEGEPASFKAGYTAENAALVVRDAFDLDADELASVRERLEHEDGSTSTAYVVAVAILPLLATVSHFVALAVGTLAGAA